MIGLSLNEIKTLNKAIDNKSIVGIKHSGNLKKGQDMQVFADSKTSLIKKGVLEDFYHFTSEGALVFGRLMKYKSAKKYIEVQDIWLGLYDENTTIAINQNGYDSFQINTIGTGSIIKDLEKKYDFVKRTDNDTSSQFVNNISYREISYRYLYEAQSRFKISYIKDEKMRSMLFFYDGNNGYFYNSSENGLYIESANRLNDRITSMIEWGD